MEKKRVDGFKILIFNNSSSLTHILFLYKIVVFNFWLFIRVGGDDFTMTPNYLILL